MLFRAAPLIGALSDERAVVFCRERDVLLGDGREGAGERVLIVRLLILAWHKLHIDIARPARELKPFPPHKKSTLPDGDLVTPGA